MTTELSAQNNKLENGLAKGFFPRSQGVGIRVLSILALTLTVIVGGAYLYFGGAGAQIVDGLLQTHKTFAQANTPMTPLSRQIIPCTMQSTQILWKMFSFWMSLT